MVSVGGAVGGLFIGFAAPYLFNALYDLPVMVSFTALLFLYLLWRARSAKGDSPEPAGKFLDAFYDKAVVLTLIVSLFAYVAFRFVQGRFFHGDPVLSGQWDTTIILSITALLSAYILIRTRGAMGNGNVDIALAAGLAFGICGFLARDTWKSFAHSRLLARNFYGALVVYDTDTDGSMGPVRVLRHGTIDHGEQFLWPQNSRYPTTYYAKGSGIGLSIQTLQMQGPMHVGMIGLGAGTITTYARPIDRYRIYDINPLVLKIAQTQFTFLTNCMAPHQVVLGDARLSLERELASGQPQQFDVLAVDAFSGDAIPVHLLTRQAFSLYWRHLKPDGVLAVHVSNRYLQLGPVVALGAEEDHKTAKIVNFETDDRNDKEESDSDWVLVTSRPGFFDQPELKVAHAISPIPNLRMWTDDYSNLYRILR
jgi:SAM-dependent methyltransferase